MDDKEQCTICLEEFTWGRDEADVFCSPCGLFCENRHFICQADFVSYCTENVFPSIFLMREKQGKVPCPRPECHAFFDPLTVFATLPETERTRYESLLREVVMPVLPVLVQLCKSLQDLLVLTCPNCKVAIDPSPDACSAIHCLNCGSYYCNLCFTPFAGPDNTQNRADAHLHAASHKVVAPGETQDPFLSADQVTQGQRRYQQRKLHVFLQLLITSSEYISLPSNGRHLASLVMILSFEDILLLQLDPLPIWKTARDETVPAPSEESIGRPSTITAVLSAGALGRAISSRNVDAAKQILQANNQALDVNHIHRAEEAVCCPLTSLAVLMDMDEIAINLIQRGANLFLRDTVQERTVLFVIIERGGKRVVDFLFDFLPRDFDWNQIVTNEKSHYPPLHVAALFNRGQWIKRLLDRGADHTREDEELRNSPLQTAVVKDNHWAALELIRGGADAMHLSSRGICAARVAAERGHLHIVVAIVEAATAAGKQRLLDQPVESTGARLLDVAIKFKQRHVMQYLVEQGAELSYLLPNSWSPIMVAILFNDEYSASFLLAAGARDCNARHEHRNALFIGIEKGFCEFARTWLHKYPQDLDAVCAFNDQGVSPLVVAVLFRQPAIVELLLKLGANVNVSFGPTQRNLLQQSIDGDMVIMHLLLQARASPVHFNTKGEGLLHDIVKSGRLDALYLLRAAYRVDVNSDVTNKGDGTKCLHVVAMHNRPHMVAILVDMGADVGAVNRDGQTALQLARQRGAAGVETALLACMP